VTDALKGIGHPKMLSSFTHPHVGPALMLKISWIDKKKIIIIISVGLVFAFVLFEV